MVLYAILRYHTETIIGKRFPCSRHVGRLNVGHLSEKDLPAEIPFAKQSTQSKANFTT